MFPGESLTVAVASDLYIREKKHRDPTWLEEDRVDAVRALRIVDEVVIHGRTGATEVILTRSPHAFVKGADWLECGLPADVVVACQAVGAQMIFVNSQRNGHTSDAVSPLVSA